MVVDETMIPWQGRLIFRQYNAGKAAKYGVKLFKLCSVTGYTYSLIVYTGKSESNVKEMGIAEKVCRDLGRNLFDEGRVLVVDNFYTSYELARYCLDHRTHLVGTVRANKKNFPSEILSAKLKKGAMVAREDQHGIVLLKWHDARDVRMLSTMHAPKMMTANEYARIENRIEPSANEESENDNNNNNENSVLPYSEQKANKKKPAVVHFYNKNKFGIDLSDQMASYATSIRKGVKWYRKLAVELLLGVSIVNSWIVYKAATRRKINIRRFRLEIASSLLMISAIGVQINVSAKQHFLSKQSERKTCTKCYARLTEKFDRNTARNKTKKNCLYL